jgi:hypothetical protein
MKADRYGTVTNIAVLTIFTLACLTGVLRHEIWLDEAHHWLLARDSHSVSNLFFNARYEGHPLLWNLILFWFTRFSTDVTGMQIIHVIIIIAAVSLFIFYAPFTRREKYLFVFGYFIFYEYALISRNYALLILFLFVALILLQRKRYAATGLSLALLANTHMFGLFIASCLVVAIVLQLRLDEREKVTKEHWVAFAIFIVGALISVSQIIPPFDSTLYTHGFKSPPIERLGRMSVVFVKCFVPIPDFTSHHFWNSNLLMSISKPLCVMISFVIFLLPALLFRKWLVVIFFFYATTMLMFVFFYVSDLSVVRHFGALYLAFITAWWLTKFYDRTTVAFLSIKIPILIQPVLADRLFTAMLSIQLIAGTIAFALDWQKPFSSSKDASVFLQQQDPAVEIMATGCAAAPISSYLGRKLYYTSDHNYGSYCFFNRVEGASVLPDPALKEEAIHLARSKDVAVILITPEPLTIEPHETSFIRPLASFDHSVLRTENHFLYRVTAP